MQEVEKVLQSQKTDTENWKKRHDELQSQFDKYIREYELMSSKFERMSAVNEDHIKDIENKAFMISQLQKRMLIQMIELHRLDFVKSQQEEGLTPRKHQTSSQKQQDNSNLN